MGYAMRPEVNRNGIRKRYQMGSLVPKEFPPENPLVMVMAKGLFQRVADEARPPAVLGRYPGMPDYFTEVLLDDLVESGAWLDLELKIPFLALWVNDEDFDFPDWNDPLIAIDQANVRKFAAMDPVVDLESLRGMKVYVIEPYIR